MSKLKKYNPETSQWEVVCIGEQGSSGSSGTSGSAGTSGSSGSSGFVPELGPNTSVVFRDDDANYGYTGATGLTYDKLNSVLEVVGLMKANGLILNTNLTTGSTHEIGELFYDNQHQAISVRINDEVIIENYAWTAEQIKKYYTYGKGRFGL